MTTKHKLPTVATQLPTDKTAALYIRQAAAGSTMGKDLRELNTQLLVTFAHNAGWTDDNLIVYNDTGIPATAPLTKREGLQALITAIETDAVHTVFLSTVYSLYRDARLADISFFIELCTRHAVFVITLDTIYDFTNPNHVRLFQFALEAQSVTMYARTIQKRSYRKGEK